MFVGLSVFSFFIAAYLFWQYWKGKIIKAAKEVAPQIAKHKISEAQNAGYIQGVHDYLMSCWDDLPNDMPFDKKLLLFDSAVLLANRLEDIIDVGRFEMDDAEDNVKFKPVINFIRHTRSAFYYEGPEN